MIRAGLARMGIVAAIFAATLGATLGQTAPGGISHDAARPDQSKEQGVTPPNHAPDKLLDLPQLKQSRASLMGGTLESIDRLRGRFVLRPFGRGKLTVAFDPRTQFVRGSKAARAQDMHPGDRVYVETVPDGTAVFARTIHLPQDTTAGTAVGQILFYDAAQGSLSIRDQLSSQPVKFRITSETIVTGAGVGSGALVQVSFLPGKDPALVREIQVLAAPGALFTFSGRITFLDLAAHQLVVANANDDQRYEIQFNPAVIEAETKALLQEGAAVTIAARFSGQGYVAETVTVLSHPTE